MQIFVKTIAGKFIKLKVEACEMISNIKAKIQEQTGAPYDQQRLLHSGNRLEDGRLVSDYAIQNNTTLYLDMSVGDKGTDNETLSSLGESLLTASASKRASARAARAASPAAARAATRAASTAAQDTAVEAAARRVRARTEAEAAEARDAAVEAAVRRVRAQTEAEAAEAASQARQQIMAVRQQLAAAETVATVARASASASCAAGRR